ncbi:glycosyltransferase [Terrabacter sp. 2YAF2]|uniref:glycosyltransferase n=1 Tax=Terrabacter sp. 2YAF2 TaxID=3233026 RepID=UPI003F9C0A00
MAPLVTVGIAFLAWDELTSQAIRSVYAQTMLDWQLILVLDGPEDGLKDVPPCVLQDSKVRVLSNGTKRGLAYSLNRISRHAEAEFLCRMDADDVMHPDRLQLSLLELINGKHDVVGSRAFAINDKGELLGRYREGVLPTDRRGYLKSNAFSHPTVMGRTEWFRSNPYDASIGRAEDKELWLRTWQTSRFFKLPDALLFYRIAQVINREKVKKTHEDNCRVLTTYSENVLERASLLSQATVKYIAQRALLGMMMDDKIVAQKYERLSDAEFVDASTALEASLRGNFAHG